MISVTGQSGLREPFWLLLPAGAVGCFVHDGQRFFGVLLKFHTARVPPAISAGKETGNNDGRCASSIIPST